MRIENAINEVQGPQQAERRQNAEVKRRRGTGRAGDVVEISNTAKSLSAQVVGELNSGNDVRPSRVEAVKQRVESGYYDKPEVREAIADAVLNSGVVDAVAQEVQEARTAKEELAQVPDVREDRVSEAKQRVETGFYDQAGVKAQIADSVLDSLVG